MDEWKRGHAWRDGKLYSFTDRRITVMRMWPDMLAWTRTMSKPWAPTRSHADDVLRGMGSYEAMPFKAGFVGPIQHAADTYFRHVYADVYQPALADIPALEARLALNLCERRWHALALMSRCPGATDLFQSNPALAFALASNWVFHRPGVSQPLRSARALLPKKQKAILEWLGFPGTERVRKILMRIEPRHLTVIQLWRLQQAIQCDHVQELLAHMSRITGEALSFVCDRSSTARVSPRLMSDLLRADELNQFGLPVSHFDQWKDLVKQAECLQRELPRTLRSLKQLQTIHDEISQEYRQKSSEAILGLEFGTPPFPAVQGITPIETGEDLLSEGASMDHCVASHSWRIYPQTYYVYRVTTPVRATLAIEKKAGDWQIAEIKGKENSAVSKEIAKRCFAKLVGKDTSVVREPDMFCCN